MAYAPASNNGPMCSGGMIGQVQPQYATRAAEYPDPVEIKSEPSDSPSSGQWSLFSIAHSVYRYPAPVHRLSTISCQPLERSVVLAHLY